MRIVVRLFASLRERAGTDRLTLEGLSPGVTVGGLKQELARRHPELGPLQAVRGVLDESWVPDATPLEEESEVGLLPPVSGGAPDEDAALERGLFELSTEPLDPEAARRRVADASCGATVVFTGTTRATNRGQQVERLDYEAFAAMAEKEMARIHADCLARFGPGGSEDVGQSEPVQRRLRLLTLHRTGTVAVGEPSVVVAVASPHRDAAFRACRFLIDELKTRVPLWKKEVYGDGHHWIGDRS